MVPFHIGTEVGCARFTVRRACRWLIPMERYRIVCKIGEGTFGEVFRAVRIEDGTLVALKKIRIARAEQGLPKAVVREIKSLEHLQDDHVVRLFEYFGTGSAVFLALEYMETDLFQLMSRMQRPFFEAEVKTILRMILVGVASIHESNVIHRVSVHSCAHATSLLT